MLGDELNPRVMTEQVGFREVLDARKRVGGCAERVGI